MLQVPEQMPVSTIWHIEDLTPEKETEVNAQPAIKQEEKKGGKDKFMG